VLDKHPRMVPAPRLRFDVDCSRASSGISERHALKLDRAWLEVIRVRPHFAP
jgi:hypothetical protein